MGTSDKTLTRRLRAYESSGEFGYASPSSPFPPPYVHGQTGPGAWASTRSRGVYRRRDAELGDEDVLEIAARASRATRNAVPRECPARHGLSDAIPSAHELALPRGTSAPTRGRACSGAGSTRRRLNWDRQSWPSRRSPRSGCTRLNAGSWTQFALRGREGYEQAHEALKRWLPRRGSQAGTLIELAQKLPRSEERCATRLRCSCEPKDLRMLPSRLGRIWRCRRVRTGADR